MTPCNMMGYPMLEIFSSAPPEVITTFYIPRKAPQHLYVTCIFLFKLFFQFLNSWWVFSNEAVRFEEEIALAVICVSLNGNKEIIQIVGLQEIVRHNIVTNVSPILLLVFLLVLNRICHQFHQETAKGMNSQKFVLCGCICYVSVLR